MPETTPTQPSAHLIQGNSSASRPGAHMPVTFEGDEPEEPTSWELIWAGARWVSSLIAKAEAGYPTRYLPPNRAEQDPEDWWRALGHAVRQALAEELLATGGLTLEEIAERLGYGEVSNFIHAFKRWKGVAPRRFQRGA